MATETIARLRISLEDIGPAKWPLVDMPTAGNLEMLHDATRAAMG